MKRIVDSNRTSNNRGTQSIGSAHQGIHPLSSGASNLSSTFTTITSATSDSTQRINLSTSVGSTGTGPSSAPLYGLLLSSSETNINLNGPSGNNTDEEEEGNSNLTVPSLLSLSNNMNFSFAQSSSRSASISSSSARLNASLPTRNLASNNGFDIASSSTSLQHSSSNDHQQHQQPRAHDTGISLLTSRSRSRDESRSLSSPPISPVMKRGRGHVNLIDKEKEKLNEIAIRRRDLCNELGKSARKENDAMVYLEGPRIYTCNECRTHLTSHDEIISKSFHGRHGRAYLFDNCVNVTIGKAEDRRLITGRHSVCDIFCKRCKSLIGWTYAKAYEPSQRYKEGKFIIEKIHLHMEESGCYDINLPAGEKRDRWRIRSMSWSSESSLQASPRSRSNTIYEYRPRAQSYTSTKSRSHSVNTDGGVSSLGSPHLSPFGRPPSPPIL